jgi:translation elongation factor EF-Tu-like GTPase
MPRKRTPSPEIQAQDKQIVAGAALMLKAIAERQNSGIVLAAVQLLDGYVDAPTPQPKPRTRKPKAQPVADVQLAHHQV